MSVSRFFGGVRKVFGFVWEEFGELIVMFGLLVAIVGGGVWWATKPTTYDFGNGAKLSVPFTLVSRDLRDKGNGIAVTSGDNVTVTNHSKEWRSLTVSFGRPNSGLLDTHGFYDLAPGETKTFGADPAKYDAMYISVSDYAQRKRDEEAKKRNNDGK